MIRSPSSFQWVPDDHDECNSWVRNWEPPKVCDFFTEMADSLESNSLRVRQAKWTIGLKEIRWSIERRYTCSRPLAIDLKRLCRLCFALGL